MPAGHLIGVNAEPLPRYAQLEVGGQEAVVARDQDAGPHGGPDLEGARRCKNGVGLARLALRQGFVDHRLWHVMEELDQRIKWAIGLPPVTQELLVLRLAVAGIAPPLTG